MVIYSYSSWVPEIVSSLCSHSLVFYFLLKKKARVDVIELAVKVKEERPLTLVGEKTSLVLEKGYKNMHVRLVNSSF